jgi:hypothetical protein
MIFTLEICINTYISASKYVDNETSRARGISPEKPSKPKSHAKAPET